MRKILERSHPLWNMTEGFQTDIMVSLRISRSSTLPERGLNIFEKVRKSVWVQIVPRRTPLSTQLSADQSSYMCTKMSFQPQNQWPTSEFSLSRSHQEPDMMNFVESLSKIYKGYLGYSIIFRIPYSGPFMRAMVRFLAQSRSDKSHDEYCLSANLTQGTWLVTSFLIRFPATLVRLTRQLFLAAHLHPNLYIGKNTEDFHNQCSTRKFHGEIEQACWWNNEVMCYLFQYQQVEAIRAERLVWVHLFQLVVHVLWRVVCFYENGIGVPRCSFVCIVGQIAYNTDLIG